MLHFKLNIPVLSIIVAAFLLTACGGTSDGGAGGGGDPGGSGQSFFTWNGSANGTVVEAANNAQVQFLTDGDLYYDGTQYSNVTVSGGTVYFNGSQFGTVTLAEGSGNTTIAVLLCTNGALASISAAGLGCSSTYPTDPGGTGTGSGNGSGSGASSTTWSGTWEWSGPGPNGCNYDDGGSFSMTLTVQGNVITGSNVTAGGVETIEAGTCQITSTDTASGGSLGGTVSGDAVTISSLELNGSENGLSFTGTGTLDGNTFTGSITRDSGGSGSFTLTMQ